MLKSWMGSMPSTCFACLFCLGKPVQGPIFTFMDGSPISRTYFTKQLNLSLASAGCSTTRYKGHCFRKGAATSALSLGIAESKIQTTGRWSSNAYKRYIRTTMLSLWVGFSVRHVWISTFMETGAPEKSNLLFCIWPFMCHVQLEIETFCTSLKNCFYGYCCTSLFLWLYMLITVFLF